MLLLMEPKNNVGRNLWWLSNPHFSQMRARFKSDNIAQSLVRFWASPVSTVSVSNLLQHLTFLTVKFFQIFLCRISPAATSAHWFSPSPSRPPEAWILYNHPLKSCKDKAPSKPFLLQDKTTQFLRLSLNIMHFSNCLSGSPLHSSLHLHLSHTNEPKLHKALQALPHKCWIEGFNELPQLNYS